MTRRTDDIARKIVAEIEAELWAQMIGPPPRPTALEWTPGGFKTIYLDEPELPECTCRCAIVHWPGCPLYELT